MSSLKDRLNADVKTALKEADKLRAVTLRGILAAIKQVEVDTRVTLDDAGIIPILTKLTSQRRDSISQFEAAQRQDLADKEKAELLILQDYLPTPLTQDEIDALIMSAITESGATQVKDMGKVMNALRPKIMGRADPAAISAKVKAHLGG